jgi:hypothetical protein
VLSQLLPVGIKAGLEMAQNGAAELGWWEIFAEISKRGFYAIVFKPLTNLAFSKP